MNARSCAALLAGLLALACSGPGEQQQLEADTHYRLANMRLQKGAYELAIREYRAAIAIDSKQAEYHFGIAEAYRRKGQTELAEKSLLRCLELDPSHQDARLNLGVVYLQEERWQDAVNTTTLLVKDLTFLNPSRALVNRGWAYYKLGDFKAAEADLREAVTDGGGYQARLNLAIVLFDEGQTLESMTHLKRAIGMLEKTNNAVARCAEAEAHFHLAKAHVKLGHRDPAISELRLGAKRGERCDWGTKSREYLTLLE